MNLKFILFALLPIIVVDVLFFFGVWPLLSKLSLSKKKWISRIYWGFTAFSIVLMLFALYHYVNQLPPPKFARTYLTGFVFIGFISKLIGSLFFLIPHLNSLYWVIKKKLSGKIKPNGDNKISRASFLRKTGTVAALLPFISLNYGMLLGAFNFKVKKVNITLPQLPSVFNGLRIVQISDIHTGSFVSENPLVKAVELINEQQADLILFTGDLVNEIAEEANPFVEVFKKLNAPMGIFSILGNHDYGDYFYQKGDTESRLHNRKVIKGIHEKMGWDLLLNEHRIIERDGYKLGLIGSENWGKEERFQKYGDLDVATQDMEKCAVNLLMTHDPSHWEEKVLPNYPQIDLTLSGHTHGFQMGVEIPGFRWSPAQYLYKQWAGLYEKEGNMIYVNRGLGFIGYPGRLGMPPEITVIELSNS